MNTSDRDLVHRTLAGDPESFGDLVERYLPLVRGVILERTRRPDEVPDLVQEVFTHAYEQLASLRDPSRFAGWLWQIAANEATDWLRGHERRKRVEGGIGADFAKVWRPDQAAEASELAERLWEALDQLPPEWRRVVVLAYLEDCPHRAIARFLGISQATVRWRLLRARRHLDRELRQACRQATHAQATSRAQTRRETLAALPVLPLVRLVTPATWKATSGQWLALPLALAVSVGLHALFGLGITRLESPMADEVPLHSPRVRLVPQAPPLTVALATPAHPLPGTSVRFEIPSTTTVGERAFLHYLTEVRHPVDQVVPMDRQDQNWTATFPVPQTAAVLFYYVSADSTPQAFLPASIAEGKRRLNRYQGQLVLAAPDGRPARGAAHQLALMADVQGQSGPRVLDQLNQELVRYPDNFGSYSLRWFLLRTMTENSVTVEPQIRAEKQALRDRYPDAPGALWVTADPTRATDYQDYARRFPRDRHADLAAFYAFETSTNQVTRSAAFARFVKQFPRSPYLDELYRAHLGLLSQDDPPAAGRLADSLISGQLTFHCDPRAEGEQLVGRPTAGGCLPVAKAYSVRFDLFTAAGDTTAAIALARNLLASGVPDPLPYMHLAEWLTNQQIQTALAKQLLTTALPWTRGDHLLRLPGFAPHLGQPPSARPALRQMYLETARLYQMACLRGLAACNRAAGDPAVAVHCLQEVASLQDSLRWREPEVEPYLELATLCESLGRWSEAEEAYRGAIRQLYSHPEAEVALERLFRLQGKSHMVQ